jgi:hypothetical protein
LPVWLQYISGAVPIRWALEAMNESLLGTHDLKYLVFHWVMTINISLILMAITHWMQGRVHDSIRLTGELSSI